MPRGGARPGAGRPRKGQEGKPKQIRKQDIPALAAAKGQTPLEFMLGVMNDRSEDIKLRAAMAQAAAPYVHAKPGETVKGKKEEQQDRADAVTSRFRSIGPPTLKAVK